MSDFSFYSDGIADATLTYSATEDSGYEIENIQDYNKDVFFKDTAIGANSINIVIDFGSAKACDFIVLGNYIATSANAVKILVEYNNADSWIGGQSEAVPLTTITSASLTDKLITFTSHEDRYWRIVISDSAAGNLTDLQFGIIHLGAAFNLSKNPEMTESVSSSYKVNTVESVSGNRSSVLLNSDIRRIWSYEWNYVTSTEKGNFEVWRDQIFIGEGLSLYPFYFTNDGGTSLYCVRSSGLLEFSEIAFQAYETKIILEEEL